MDATKIQLSATEMSLVNDASIILTKNKILQKVSNLLETVQAHLVDEVKNDQLLNQSNAFTIHPKISKGENYEGLPYLILDYPRVFDHQNIFTIRQMFWWGNLFSCTLQIGGIYKSFFKESILNSYNLLSENSYYLGINTNPWLHHFNEDNYQPIKNLSFEAFEDRYSDLPQIKIAAKWPLSSWTFAANNFIESWRFLINLTNHQLPKR